MSIKISISRGSIYIPSEVYDTYINGIEAIIALIRDGKLFVLPVQHVSAGGCLLKIRNARGDRVAAAQDVFAANELSDAVWSNLDVHWDSSQMALVCELPKS